MAIRAALDDAGVDASEVDALVAFTPGNDARICDRRKFWARRTALFSARSPMAGRYLRCDCQVADGDCARHSESSGVAGRRANAAKSLERQWAGGPAIGLRITGNGPRPHGPVAVRSR